MHKITQTLTNKKNEIKLYLLFLNRLFIVELYKKLESTSSNSHLATKNKED